MYVILEKWVLSVITIRIITIVIALILLNCALSNAVVQDVYVLKDGFKNHFLIGTVVFLLLRRLKFPQRYAGWRLQAECFVWSICTSMITIPYGHGAGHSFAEKREERSLERFQKQLARHHLLVLDELGYVPFSKAGAELLFDLVSQAYEQTSLIVTTNLPFEEWTELMGSERLTGALLDQLIHRVHILEANGESYRLKESQKRMKRQSPKGSS